MVIPRMTLKSKVSSVIPTIQLSWTTDLVSQLETGQTTPGKQTTTRDLWTISFNLTNRAEIFSWPTDSSKSIQLESWTPWPNHSIKPPTPCISKWIKWRPTTSTPKISKKHTHTISRTPSTKEVKNKMPWTLPLSLMRLTTTTQEPKLDSLSTQNSCELSNLKWNKMFD